MVEQSVLGIFQRICISQSNNVNVGFGLWNRTQEEKEQNIRRWLQEFSAPNGEEFMIQAKDFAEGLRDNVMTSSEFRPCLEMRSHTFVLFGSPGVGKTTTKQGIIKKLDDDREAGNRDVVVASIFYKLFKPDRYDPNDCKASKVMMRILAGFVKRLPEAIQDAELHKLWNSSSDKCPDPEATAKVIMSILNKAEAACVVLDGVDECHLSDCQEQLSITLQLLRQIQNETGVGVIITDRLLEENFWKDHFSDTSLETYKINVDDLESDIRTYVSTRFKDSPRMKWVYQDKDLLQTATSTIMDASNKIFLFVWLNVEYLLRKGARSKEGFQEYLEKLEDVANGAKLPNTGSDYTQHVLSRAFNSYLTRIFPDDDISHSSNLARRAFRYVRDAARPFQFPELRVAVAWNIETGQWESENDRDWDDLQRECSGMIICDSAGCIQFYHDAIRIVFGEDEAKEALPDADEALGKISVQYLLQNSPSRAEEMSESELHDLTNSKPFLQYAAKYWPAHFRKWQSSASGDGKLHKYWLFHDALELLKNDELVEFVVWMAGQDDPDLAIWLRDVGSFALRKFAEMHHLSMKWLGYLLIEHLNDVVGEQQDRVDPLVANRTTGLHLASREGWCALVRALLKEKKACECRDRQKRTPLHIAAAFDQLEVVEVLLEHGVDTDATDQFGFTSLMTAALYGHESIVKRLLEQGDFRINVQSNSRCSPFKQSALHIAVSQGHIGIVTTLLDHPKVDVTKMNSHGETPFHLAARKGDLKIVKQFVTSNRVSLKAGTGPGPDGKGCTVLHLASMDDKNKPVVEYLLELSPALCHECDDRGRTALHYAVQWEAKGITELLLQSTLNVNKKDTNGLTALMYTFKSRSTALFRMFEASDRIKWDVEGEQGHLMLERAQRWSNDLIVKSVEERVATSIAKTLQQGLQSSPISKAKSTEGPGRPEPRNGPPATRNDVQASNSHSKGGSRTISSTSKQR